MKIILFMIVKSVLLISCYTLIYIAQATNLANAQIKTLEKEKDTPPPPLLIKKDSLVFEDLDQISSSIKVMNVIDGKTFVDHEGTIYTLASLDTQMDSHLEELDYARQSKDFLDSLIKDQTLILFQTKNKKFGRENRMGHQIIHALREKDHTWIQATLLANGMARVRTSAFNAEQATQLLGYEASARERKKGIWSNDSLQIFTTEEAHNRIGGFHIVEGKVKSTAIVKNKVYVNFGDSWKTDFTIGIAPKVRRDLSHEAIDVLNWAGKTLRVRGWLRSYNGPYIELTHAQQIEIIETEMIDHDKK